MTTTMMRMACRRATAAAASRMTTTTRTASLRWMSGYPPHEVVGLPSLSPTMESGTIASWNMEVGDAFGPGDVLCSVETDKATVDFEAQDDGVLAKILVEAGSDEIKCGTPIAITVEDADDAGAFGDYTVEAAPTPAAAAPTPEPAAPTPTPAAPTPTPSAAAPPTPASASPTGGRVVASPLAHMLAKDAGFDIGSIAGTGPGGRILAADVKEFQPSAVATEAAPAASAAVATPASPPVSGDGFTDYPLSADAKEVAARLAQSKRNVPHYYLTVDVAMDELLAMRAKLGLESLGTYELLLKAAAAAMKAVPAANGSWRGDVVRLYDDVDINVVVGTGDELYTPIMRDVGKRGLKSLSDDLRGFMEAVESEDDVPADFGATGTFTVMNLGAYGIKSCAPIIREPQACALALGAIENRIVPAPEDSDEIYEQATMMTVTLSCDHRVVDGAVGAQWLAAFKSHVENPTTLLL